MFAGLSKEKYFCLKVLVYQGEKVSGKSIETIRLYLSETKLKYSLRVAASF